MSWDNSDRKSRLPDDWDSRRRAVEERAGGRCEAIHKSGKRCHDKGNQCDHVLAGDDHSLNNLQWLCEWHHSRKSSAEGHAAQAAKRNKRLHPKPPHPGSIPPKEAGNASANQAGQRKEQPISAFEWRSKARRDAGSQSTER